MDGLEHAAHGLPGWWNRLDGEASPIGMPLNSSSLALEASRLVKSGPGTLFGFSGFSNKGAGQFVLVFDSRDLPAAGAVPVLVVNVAATSNFSYDAGQWGRAFHQGIAIANSSTVATLTAGSADCWIDAQYV